MEIKKNISAPLQGMNRDSNLDRLQDGEFTFALNSDSNGRVRHNEPSNYLYTIFPEGYRVISEPLRDNLKNRTYYWLTNPETSFSSFGYVEDRRTFHDNEDQENSCGDCDPINTLSEPLENTTQTPEFPYVELFHDRCLPKGEGLNLSIDFPIKSPVIKSELSGTTIYWEDDRNPPRYVRVDDVSYLYEIDQPCSEPQTDSCIQIHKLLQFPDSEPLYIEAVSQNIGGNLRRGSYEIFAAYCDELGAEMSEYSSSSNVIKIFDVNNNVLTQQELDDYTNYAIKVKIENLDTTNFKYYKIVVVERGNIDSTQIAFEEGIFPTSTEEVIITSSGRLYNNTNRDVNLQTKKTVNLNKLFLSKPKIEKAEGESIIGGRKYIYGVKRKEQLNIQPVVNLFSSLAEWQTVFAKDGLYKDGVIASKYGTYNRSEVQAFALRLLYKDGGKSQVFPMVGRPPKDSDLLPVPESVIIDSGCGSNDRDKRWQYFDTATSTEQLYTDIQGEEIFQNEVKSCLVENVFTIPSNTSNPLILNLDRDFTTLKDYIEDNPDEDVEGVTYFLNQEYPETRCYPYFGVVRTFGQLEIGKQYIIHNINAGDDFSNVGFTQLHQVFTATGTTPTNWTNFTEVEETTCGDLVLQDYNVSIAEVVNEDVKKEEAKFPDEYQAVQSSTCSIYETGTDGKPVRDTYFEDVFDYRHYSSGIHGYRIYKRTYNFNNESCSLADQIQIISGLNTNYQKYWFRYEGANTREELEHSNKYSDVTLLDSNNGGFGAKIQKTALWFKGQVDGMNKFILEVTKTQNPSNKDEIVRGNVNPLQLIRVSLFNRCSDQNAIFSKIVSARNEGVQLLIEKLDNGINITSSDEPNTTVFVQLDNPLPSDSFYVSVDPYVTPTKGGLVDPNAPGWDEDLGYNEYNSDFLNKFRTAPPHGCFGVLIRPIEYVKAKVTWDAIILNKVETYISSCKYTIPDIGECEAIPYEKGEFGYFESSRTYPNNKDLFDSSSLVIKPEHLNFQPYSLRQRFENMFVDGYNQDGSYILNPEYTDLRCKPIRHFKFPSNLTSPYLYNVNLPSGTDRYIFPIGVTLDARVVQSMLVVAKENKLITQEQFDNVIGFEILRGDDTYSRSVVGNGILFDMYEYEADNKKTLYPNYPYNDLGDDLYHFKPNTTTAINHPYNGERNNRFTLISPDLLYTGTNLPNEVYVQGFLRGKADNRFSQLNDHAKWTILGRKARRTALTLATAEAALEAAINIGTATGNQWFMGGMTFGSSLGLVGVGIITAANVLSGFTKIGEYRYQWIETFRNLGSSRNFAYYMNGLGTYNTFIKNTNENNQVFRLSVSKYLPNGNFTVLDTKLKENYRINNESRERSVFISTGDKFLNYPVEYIQIDNNKFSNESSKNTNSRVGCGLNTFDTNIASPYVSLRNYIPDQWGDLGSIRWLTTGKQYKFGVDNRKDTTFGGSVYITPMNYWRKLQLFKQLAHKYPDKLAYEYSSKSNIAKVRFFCDYETDTEFNDLLIPFPDIDSDYNFDCLTTSNSFYLNSGKFYTSFRNVINFPVETRMNLEWRYGGKEIKEQFYPIQSDIEYYSQETNLPISEEEQILYSNTYSLPNTYSGATSFPVSYDREFYKKISENKNEVIWSEQDFNETNKIQDPYLVYKPLNTFSFETSQGILKSLKEITSNTAVARFTNGMQVFNTVDVLAERITPQTQELGTGGIFAKSRPVSFNNSSFGFTGTQHYNVIETEFGDIHIDSDRGQILLLNSQGNQLEDISYSFQGQPSNMNKWFKKHLPFKIKNYFPEIDVDNPFLGIGISGGYDAVNKRAFITKLDFEPLSDCIEYDTELGLVINETKCNGAPQVPTCPEGYTYNPETQQCEKTVLSSPCPIGYHFENGVCVQDDEDYLVCETDVALVVDISSSVSPEEMAQQKVFLIQIINHLSDKMADDKVRVSLVSFKTDATIELNLTNDAQAVINAINNLPNSGTGQTNTVDGLCLGRSALIGVNSRVGVNKNLILITDGKQNRDRINITCSDATTFLPPSIGAQEMVVRYGAKLKSEGIFITTIAIGSDCETAAVTRLYGGDTTIYTGTVDTACTANLGQPNTWGVLWGDPDYPLSSVGNGLFGYSTYQTEFSSAVSIAEEIALTTCFSSVPIDCGSCNFNETVNLCECEESVEPTYVDKVSPVELTNTNYFRDVSWTIAFKFEEKGFNSYHSFHPNFYNPHQDFFQTGFNSNNSKLWSHTLEDNSFQVFQGQREPFIVETVVTNKNTSKYLNSIAIESEAIRYQDGVDSSQWWDKGFDTLTIYNNTDNSGRLKLTPLKNYRDLTKYPINNPNNTQTITFVPQDEKHLVNYFYNRTRREDRNIPQWIYDRNQIMKDINPKAVKFTGKQLLERLRGNSFIIRLENESESRFKINLKDVITEQTNYQS